MLNSTLTHYNHDSQAKHLPFPPSEEAQDRFATMAHQSQQADGANSQSDNFEQHPSITTKQFEQFSRKLLTLQTTIDIIAGVSRR
jgi:hypothetical protein